MTTSLCDLCSRIPIVPEHSVHTLTRHDTTHDMELSYLDSISVATPPANTAHPRRGPWLPAVTQPETAALSPQIDNVFVSASPIPGH